MSKLNSQFVKITKKLHIDRNLFTYLICVIIATILWFLNALNKDYIADISYPVKYVNLPKGKYFVSDPPKTLVLEVKAKGFALLGHRASTSFLPITFNVNSYSNHQLEKDNVYEYTINTSDLKEKITTQLNADIKLQAITPETIEFKFAPSVSKKIAIYPSVKYSLKRQYILKNKITTIPDSIIVSGPSVIMDTLQYIHTETLNLKEIGKDISKSVELVNVPKCSFEDTEVQLDISVEQYTEARRTIQITEINVPDSITLRLFPNYVNITYDIGLSQYDKVSDTDFVFTVDYKQHAISSFLDVKVTKFPPFIKDLSFTPQRVEYIMEHRKITPEEKLRTIHTETENGQAK